MAEITTRDELDKRRKNGEDIVGKFYSFYSDDMINCKLDEILGLLSMNKLHRNDFLEDGTLNLKKAIDTVDDLRMCWDMAKGYQFNDYAKEEVSYTQAMNDYINNSGALTYVKTYIAGVSIDDILV